MRGLVLVGIVLAAATAQAKPKPGAKAGETPVAVHANAADVKRLGDAFRAYDRGELDTAKQLADKIGEVANKDYLWWLRGMIALRQGDAAAARRAFDKLAKQPGSHFAAQVPWRLADCAWLQGDRENAAKQYARLIAMPNAEEAGDLGTAMYR